MHLFKTLVIICTCTLLVYLTHNINLLYTVPAKVNKVDKDLKVFRLVRLHAMKRVTWDIFRLTRTCWTLTNVKVHKNKFKVTKNSIFFFRDFIQAMNIISTSCCCATSVLDWDVRSSLPSILSTELISSSYTASVSASLTSTLMSATLNS